MKIKLLFITLLLSTLGFAQSKGTISGTITDKDLNNESLPFANVTVKGTNNSKQTDIDGKYSIELKPGAYVLVFSFLGYESQEEKITIAAGEKKTVNKSLSSGSVSLEDVVIESIQSREKETALLLEQKNAVEIKQSIGAQELSRKGVSDVEEGLTKITGITKVDGRGIFVRGLEDRYNNLLINGLAVPSNNPFKKIIPLDLFPTDIVSVIETYKTFNTNIYGDFAGGTFDIVTARGNKSMTKINIGTSFTTNNNLKKFLISEDGNSTGDFFGFSGNERDMPSVMAGIPRRKDFTAEESQNQFGSGFNVEEEIAPLNTSLGILHSEKFNLKNNNTFNYLFSINYDNKYQVREGVDRFFTPGQGNYSNDLYNKQYKFTTNSSLLGVLNYKTDRFTLTSNTFYLKTTENMIQDQLGYTNGAATNTSAFIRLNQLTETSFFNSQLLATYKLTADERQEIKAGASYTKTTFELPDRKSFSGFKQDDETTGINYSGNSLLRQYFDISGKFYASGMVEYNWKFGNEDITKANKLTAGYNGYMNDMESSYRFAKSNRGASGNNQVAFPTNTPDDVFKSAIQNSDFYYSDASNSTYQAKLKEFVNAGYVDLALKFGESYELNIGARVEQSSKETKYREQGSFDDPLLVKKTDNVDLLPSLNMKYKVSDASNLRFSASKTITRPVIMEAFPLEFVNLDGTIENGNSDIVNSDNYNVDLKYEIFPTNKELFAVTAFSKYLQNPIERIFMNSAGSGGQIMSYANSKKALLLGAELEFLVQLDRVSQSLKDLSLGFNTSVMYTKVTNDNVVETDNERQLQGASPWLINADLKYEFDFSESWSNTVSLVYNVYGKRIFAVGTQRLDHYYEMPFNKLDFIWNSKLSSNWDLKFAAENLLNPKYKIEMGDKSKIDITESDLTVKDYKKGVGFSLNLAYTF
ncbi:TonB-dependent receptor [uncultured Flavobacterium sp.]|uniref:TonB-dependent receptor n=1 Tax=uncultured Flavobacterium sp. TaxID=165435 RepID=UPI0025EFD6B4|nr:TonB-dependent receptor [uncultured Flavobacterium sp.]